MPKKSKMTPTQKFLAPIAIAGVLCIGTLIVANAITDNSILESAWENAEEVGVESEPIYTYSAYGIQFQSDDEYTVVGEIETDTEAYTLWVNSDGNYVCIIDYYQVDAVEDQEEVSEYTGEFETTEDALCLANNLYSSGFQAENHGYKGLSGLLFTEKDESSSDGNIAMEISPYDGYAMYYIIEEGQVIYSTGSEDSNIKVFQYVSLVGWSEEE